MFAVLHLPDFALQAVLRHEPELWTRPLALVDPTMTAPRVCTLTAAARAAGVTEGLTPTQAMARCPSVLIRHRSSVLEAAATDAMLQCAYGFSPHLESTAPGIGTLDLRGLAALRAGDAQTTLVWAGHLRTALMALNLQARIGLGPTPNVARHAARWAALDTAAASEIQMVSQADGFIRSLPVAALEPSSDVALILHKWGIRSVGQLLALGQEALAERIGLEAFALFAAASTTALRPLRLVRPAERYEESFEFELGVETIEPLLFILRRFVDQLAQRLELTGLVAAVLALGLRLESGQVLERRLHLPQPTRQPDILFRMLQTHLETLRTDEPIIGVALQADPTESKQKQFTLFEAALRDPHQFQETLANLSALVGADRVGTPVRENSHRPDAFKLMPPDFENAPEGSVRRDAEILRAPPLRRFRPPVPATVESEAQEQVPGPSPGLNAVEASPEPRGSSRREEALFSSPGSQSLPTSAATVHGADARLNANETPTALLAPRPISIRCRIVKGKVKVAVGPWRASGRWWEPGAWQREEWDVETHDGSVFRLNHDQDGWHVEGVLD